MYIWRWLKMFTGWHHWLDGCESEWTLGVGDGQGDLACCDSWGRKELDMTERLIWSDLIWKMFKLVLEKAEEPEIKLPTSTESSKKQESSRKTSTSALLTMPKPLTVWITTNCGKFFKRWEYQTTWPASWDTCMQVRKQQLELDMEQQTGSK